LLGSAQLRRDFGRIRIMADLVLRREKIMKAKLDLQNEIFEQQVSWWARGGALFNIFLGRFSH
tara:strand:- start:581 stop:769 length:189 start_codon:yes stop_codon:yes gene_type:complete